MKLNEAIDFTKEYYKGNIPTTVSQYMKDYPKGLSRQVLKSRYNLTAGEFLKLLGSEYKATNKAKDLIQEQMNLKGLMVLESLDNKTTKCRVKYKCKKCGNEFTTSYDSLRLSKYGCSQCANNKPLYLRHDFVSECAKKVGSKVISIPTNNKGRVVLECNSCNEEYSIALSKLTNPQTSKEGTCPNCRDTDRRVTYKGIVFGSGFERDCYKILEHLNPEIHVRYKDHFDTTRLWVCDFVLGDYWIEVSNFKTDYKNYFDNIKQKEQLVKSSGKSFIFLTSLAEVVNFVNKI